MDITSREIAVIGMACRVPGASDYEEFWNLLLRGAVVTGSWPSARQVLSPVWQRDGSSKPAISPDLRQAMAGGFLDGIDEFDPALFGITPREARFIDPQQRILLEESWRALQDAGLDPRSLAGTNTAVVMGLCSHDYSLLAHEAADGISPYAVLGAASCIAANRISFSLGLRGPSVSIDAACAASALAIHTAISHLVMGDCDLALAGGANVILTPTVNAGFQSAHMLSKSGRCLSFDQAADGYVRSEGAGVLVLKRLKDAIEAGDPIHAVVLSSQANQDGRTSSIAVPSRDAQVELMKSCMAKAGIGPADVDFVEAHGTGTPVGDPVEATALADVFRGRPTPCWIGALKGNIGHTEAASGVLAAIKAILALNRRLLPGNVSVVNPIAMFSDLEGSIRLPQHATPLHEVSQRSFLCAGVSAFGFGGTNVHTLLRSPLPDERGGPQALGQNALRLSAHSSASLRTMVAAWCRFLRDLADSEFPAAVAFANAAYGGEKYSVDIVADNPQETAEKLRSWLDGLSRDPANAENIGLRPQTSAMSRTRPSTPVPFYPFLRGSYWAPHVAAPLRASATLPETLDIDFGQAYIGEHRIGGEVIVPGASIIMSLQSTIRSLSSSTSFRIKNVEFKAAFVLRQAGDSAARLFLTPSSPTSYAFQLKQMANGLTFATGEVSQAG